MGDFLKEQTFSRPLLLEHAWYVYAIHNICVYLTALTNLSSAILSTLSEIKFKVSLPSCIRQVFLGRPLLWGLACSGEEGALNILNILKGELDSTMALSGK